MPKNPTQISGKKFVSDEDSELMVEQDVRAAIEIAGDVSWMNKMDSGLDDVDISGLTDITMTTGPGTEIGRVLNKLLDDSIAKTSDMTVASLPDDPSALASLDEETTDDKSDNETDGAT